MDKNNLNHLYLEATTPSKSNMVRAIPLVNHTIIYDNQNSYYEIIDNIFYKTNLCFVENHEEATVAPWQFSRTEESYTPDQLLDKYQNNVSFDIVQIRRVDQW